MLRLTVFLEPNIPHSERDSIIPLEDGFVQIDIGMANPGSNYNQPNVLCLINGAQVACTPEVDVSAADSCHIPGEKKRGTVIAVDTGILDQAKEFQIGIVPLKEESYISDLKQLRFTFAITLSD